MDERDRMRQKMQVPAKIFPLKLTAAAGVLLITAGTAFAQWQPLEPARELAPLPGSQGLGSPAQETAPAVSDPSQDDQAQVLPDADPAPALEPDLSEGTDPYGQAQQSTASEPQEPDVIENPVAVFSGLDKITGRITSFDVYINETVQFGALQITPRVCHTRPATESPETTGFVQVDEITLNNEVRRIFSGWMFAGSPGLHAVEHAVYDVWLTDCKKSSPVPPPEGYDGPPVEKGAEEGLDPLAGDVETGKVGMPLPKPF